MFNRFRSRCQEFPAALRGLILAASVAVPAILVGAEAKPETPLPARGMPITHFSGIHTLSAEEAKLVHPISAEAEVIYFDPNWHLLWVRDGEATVYVYLGSALPDLKQGEHFKVQGVYRTSGLDARDVKVTALPALPPVVPTPLSFLSEDEIKRHDSDVVTYEGFVGRQFEIDSTHTELDVVVEGRKVITRVWNEANSPVPQYEGRIVKIKGLLAPKVDPMGRVAEVSAWVCGFSDVTEAGPLESDARFSLPLTPMERWPTLPSKAAVRIQGTVQGLISDQGITLRGESGQVYVRTEQPTPVQVGQRVEAVGYPASEGVHWTLERALFRRIERTTTSAEPPAGVLTKLRLAAQIMELSPAEAARAHPVALWAVVLWSDPKSRFCFVHDSSGAVRIECAPGVEPPAGGSGIVLSGVTASGAFAPLVKMTSYSTGGTIAIPEPRRMTLEQALTGVEEAQWIGLRGFVREIKRDGAWTRLQVTSSAGEFSAFLPPTESVASAEGAVVSIRGVCAAVPNDRRQLVGIDLWVPKAACIEIEEPPPTDVFRVPARAIASLREYHSFDSLNRRVRLTATVLHHVPGEYLLVQDRDEGLLVLSRETRPLARGDRVEVVGFPGREGARVVLREAVYRRISAGEEPPALALAGGQRTTDEELDGRLVRLDAGVIDAVSHGADHHYVLQAQPTIFGAQGRFAESEAGPLAPIGSMVRVTGVYRLEYDEYRRPNGFHLQLRSPQDIAVLEAPSWWTVRRAALVAAILGLLGLAGLGWGTALKRRVRQQTAQIREQMEKESNLEARFRDIVQNASDVIFTVDRTGRFTSLNPAGERIFGYLQQEALGMKIQDLLAPEDQDVVLPFLAAGGAPGRLTVTSQSRFRSREGRVLWIEISARRTHDLVGEAYTLGVARDITERKQIEEELKRARDAAEASTKAKSAFLANMSHEIRTPMNGVIGMCSLLMDTKLNDVQRDFAETIRNSAEALLTVLNDILDFSKIEAGKLHFEDLDFNLRETVDQTLELLAARAAGKGLELAAFVPTDLPCFLRGDSGRLRQVLLNLIGNAVKFTEKGEVVVHISTEEKTEKTVRLRLEVTDTGIGLAPDAVPRLFQPFSQADSSTTRKFGGTGLGLAISKQIVELMGGMIGVRSELGRGSTFWFTVALERQVDRPSRAPLAPADSLRGRRALIIDDNQTNRRIVEHYLTSWSVTSDQAVDGPSALEKLRANAAAGTPYELAVVDFEMPGMNGVTLATQIHDDPALRALRVVLCTSWDQLFDRAELQRIGVRHLMMKPIRQAELLNGLLQAIAEPIDSAPQELPTAPVRTPSMGPVPKATPVQSVRVLIAEDNAVNQRVTFLQLQKLGYRADVASTGVEVLENLERGDYQLVLMDCQMPEMDGFEATRHIRRHPRHGGVKIIAMTANAMQGDRERCIAAGMDDYVSKPTRPNELQDAIARCMGAGGS